ncbi:MAG: DUF2141 domain-containing protein [Pseudomonadota bacterium]
MKPIRSAATGITLSLGLCVLGAWLASGLAYSTPVISANNTQLSVQIEGVRNDKGKLIVMIFNTANAFMNFDYNGAAGFEELKASGGKTVVNFTDLPTGPHAVVLHHDENSDYEFNMKGEWPLEGYGTSNAKDAYDEPSFREALVNSDTVTVQMHYLQ